MRIRVHESMKAYQVIQSKADELGCSYTEALELIINNIESEKPNDKRKEDKAKG